MGDYRIRIDAVGGHGCSRKEKAGEALAPLCDNKGCPDCAARRLVAELQVNGSSVGAATITHWPNDSPSGSGGGSEIVDDILNGKRKNGSF